MWDDKLLKFQWQVLRTRFEKDCLRPRFVSTEYDNLRIMSDIFKQTPCKKKICDTSNVWFNHEDNVINFFMIRNQNPRKK